jgi:hypothetical protein
VTGKPKSEDLAFDVARDLGEEPPRELSALARRMLLQPRGYDVERAFRIPLALVARNVSPMDGHNIKEIQVQTNMLCRPLTLVVDRDTAKYFDLASFEVGNMRMALSDEPWPLETFSIEFVLDDKIALVNHFAGWPTIETFTRLKCSVRRRQDEDTEGVKTFRGLLWCEARL